MKFQQPFITIFKLYFIFVEIETFKLEAHKQNVPKYLFNEFVLDFINFCHIIWCHLVSRIKIYDEKSKKKKNIFKTTTRIDVQFPRECLAQDQSRPYQNVCHVLHDPSQ